MQLRTNLYMCVVEFNALCFLRSNSSSRGDQLPWISPEIQLEISLRNRMLKHHRRQRNKVTSLKRKGVKEFCKYATTASKNPGEFWRKMKPPLPSSRSNTQSSITLVENGCVISNPSERLRWQKFLMITSQIWFNQITRWIRRILLPTQVLNS